MVEQGMSRQVEKMKNIFKLTLKFLCNVPLKIHAAVAE